MADREKPKVLIVDDDPDLLEIIACVLSESKCEVTAVNSAKEALGAIEHKRFDVVISDIVMPDMNGRHLLFEIEKRQGYKPYVVMMSGYSLYSEETLHHDGACGYLSKPFTRHQLEEIVNVFLGNIVKV